MSKSNPNPNGKTGNPIALAPYALDDALRKSLAALSQTKSPKEAKKKSAKRKW